MDRYTGNERNKERRKRNKVRQGREKTTSKDKIKPFLKK